MQGNKYLRSEQTLVKEVFEVELCEILVYIHSNTQGFPLTVHSLATHLSGALHVSQSQVHFFLLSNLRADSETEGKRDVRAQSLTLK